MFFFPNDSWFLTLSKLEKKTKQTGDNIYQESEAEIGFVPPNLLGDKWIVKMSLTAALNTYRLHPVRMCAFIIHAALIMIETLLWHDG